MIFLGLAAVVALVGAWLIDRRRRVYADLGTTPAAAVSAGRNEVKGRAWHAEPLSSHLTATACVWWSYLLEEERQHTRTVTNTDPKGNTSTHTETYTEWHEIDDRADACEAVDVVDESGSVRVVLRGAKIGPRETVREIFSEKEERSLLSRLVTFDSRTGRYRRTERVIAIGDALFVVGEASLPDDVAAPQIDHGSPFIVSTRSEESHRNRLGWAVPVLVLVALACAAVAGNAVVAGPAGVAGGVGVVVVGVGAAVLVIVFNRLRLLDQQAARSWSLIDIQLTRRHDLIPQLASVARAGAGHERAALETATVQRSTGAPTPDEANREVAAQTRHIESLLATIEAYPQLKADSGFRRLAHELADTENRIAGAREFYNTTVTLLRDRAGTFPGLLVARWAEPRRYELFSAEGFHRTVPKPVFAFDDSPS